MIEPKAVSNTQLDEDESLDTDFGDPRLMGDGDEGSENVEQNIAGLKHLLGEARQRVANLDKALRHAG